MIKAYNILIEKTRQDGRDISASLKADTAAEVTSIGNDASTVVNCLAGDKFVLGTTCLTATGDFGLINSDGIWTF